MAGLPVWTWAFAPGPPSAAETCWATAAAGGRVADDGRPSASPPPRPRRCPGPPDPVRAVGARPRCDCRRGSGTRVSPRIPEADSGCNRSGPTPNTQDHLYTPDLPAHRVPGAPPPSSSPPISSPPLLPAGRHCRAYLDRSPRDKTARPGAGGCRSGDEDERAPDVPRPHLTILQTCPPPSTVSRLPAVQLPGMPSVLSVGTRRWDEEHPVA